MKRLIRILTYRLYDGIDLGGYRENQNYNLIREVRYRLGLMGRGMPMSGVPFFFSIHCRTVWGRGGIQGCL